MKFETEVEKQKIEILQKYFSYEIEEYVAVRKSLIKKALNNDYLFEKIENTEICT